MRRRKKKSYDDLDFKAMRFGMLCNRLERCGRYLREADHQHRIPEVLDTAQEIVDELQVQLKALRAAKWSGAKKPWKVSDGGYHLTQGEEGRDA